MAPTLARPATLLLLAAVLAACDGDGAPDDRADAALGHAPVRIASAAEALANVAVATVDPATMTRAEMREGLGAEPRCVFRYTAAGRPVVALGGPSGTTGVVKLNGALVRLEAAAGDPSTLSDGPVRVRVAPEDGAFGGDWTGTAPAAATFEVGEDLRVGYLGTAACGE